MSMVVLCALTALVAAVATWIAARRGQRGDARLPAVERALASAHAGTFTYYPKRNLVVCSQAMRQLLGYAAERSDPSYEEWLKIVHDEDRPALEQLVNESLQRGTPYSCDYRIRTHGGYVRWVRSHAQAV